MGFKMCHLVKTNSKKLNNLKSDFFYSDIVIERKRFFLVFLPSQVQTHVNPPHVSPPSPPPYASVLAFLPISQLTDEFPAGNIFDILPAVTDCSFLLSPLFPPGPFLLHL